MTNLSEIQVSRSALRHNLEALKSLNTSGARIAAVVKGNAYGHGLKEVVEVLDGRVDYFQLDDIDELRELRKWSNAPALVLGFVPSSEVGEALELGAELAVYDCERLPALEAAAERLGHPARVHLKIEALLGRQGVLPSELDGFLESLRSFSKIEIAATYAHFANIEDTTDMAHAFAQVEIFEACLCRIRDSGWPDAGRHLSATSGLMTYEQQASNDLMRLGIGLYGLYPSSALARRHADLDLKPALRWVSHLAQVKTLPPGHPIGYGLTYITAHPTRVGVVPQGYSDGFDRGFSNSGEVLVGGKRCPILGRVAMNMFVIDLNSVPSARPEDEVVLLGDQVDERITAEELAARLATINYEIPTRISPLLPRVLL